MSQNSNNCNTSLLKTSQILLFLIISSLGFSQDPTFSWARNYGGNDRENVMETTTDSENNILVCGYFESTSNLEFVIENETTNLVSNGLDDVFILKLDADGNTLWALSFGGSGTEYCFDIETDSNDNIYIAGQFQGTVDFDPSSNVNEVISNGGSGTGGDIFLLKLASDGQFQWVYTAGSSSSDSMYGMTIDTEDNVICTGRYSGMVEFNPSGGNILTSPTDQEAAYILKLDSNGGLIWVGSFLGANGLTDVATAIESDNENNVILIGQFDQSEDFDPGVGEAFLTEINPGTANNTRFVLKLNSEGEYIWAHAFQQFLNDYRHNEMTVDAEGNIVLIGKFIESVDFDPSLDEYILEATSSFDGFVQKLSPDGDFVWAARFNHEDINSIISDSNSGLYITGGFGYSTDFDPSEAEYNVSATSSNNDLFILHLSAEGEFIWALNTGAIADETGEAIALDANNNILIAGEYSQLFDLDPTEGEFLSTIDAGSRDMFILKLSNGCSLDLTVSNIDTALFVQSGFSSYQWLDCSDFSLIEGATEELFVPESSGSYSAILNNGSCIDTTECSNIVVSGITELLSFSGVIQMSPNPVSYGTMLNLSFESESNEVFELVEILDLSGRIVNTFEVPQRSKSIQLFPLITSGTYIVVVRTNKGSYVTKLNVAK